MTVVIPVLNAMRFLPCTIPAVLEAAGNTQGVGIIWVDNGSSDGSYEYLLATAQDAVQVQRYEGISIAALRNLAANGARGEYLSFLDADCVIRPSYFNEALAVLRVTGAAATGCEVEVPTDAHWLETTWHELHYVNRERDVHYLNSGNFFISRHAFENVGGFREDLPTGEDAEIGQRLTTAGYVIREAPIVGAVHLGNPKSVREFYRRNVWHGLGMFGTVNRGQLDRPTTMMILHLLATILGLFLLIGGHFSLSVRILLALSLQLPIPIITVAYRVRQTGRATHLGEGLVLYLLYYLARLHALALLLARQSHRYAK